MPSRIKSMAGGLICLLGLGLMATSTFAEPSALVAKWQEETNKVGEWSQLKSDGTYTDQRLGQTCDVYRPKGAPADFSFEDNEPGCVVLFAADPTDAFTAVDLPLNQQNNFQNTQHYLSAYNFHGKGVKADSLPRAPEDLNPVCYVIDVNGTKALGYEEGNGDVIMPCPGAQGAYPYTEDEIMSATPEELEEMCNACYVGVCSRRGSRDPKSCGGRGQGGYSVGAGAANNGIVATLEKQASTSYHCHLTLADEGACDYVQFDQHEDSRDYYMQYGVMCGWNNVRNLNITYCDCTREAGTANGCARKEALAMALEGVVCGNCGGLSQSTAYNMIFGLLDAGFDTDYSGVCARARITQDPEDTYQCSKGLFCRDGRNMNDQGCKDHCEWFKDADCRCPGSAAAPCEAGARKLLEIGDGETQAEPMELPEIVSAPIRSRKLMM